jgi:hypothetical protein
MTFFRRRALDFPEVFSSNLDLMRSLCARKGERIRVTSEIRQCTCGHHFQATRHDQAVCHGCEDAARPAVVRDVIAMPKARRGRR